MTEEKILSEKEVVELWLKQRDEIIEDVKKLLAECGENINKQVGEIITKHCDSYNKSVEKLATAVVDTQKKLIDLRADVDSIGSQACESEWQISNIKKEFASNQKVENIGTRLIMLDHDFENRVEQQLQRDGYILGKAPEEAEAPLF